MNPKQPMQPMWNFSNSAMSGLSQEESCMPYENIQNIRIPQYPNGRVVGIANKQVQSSFQMIQDNDNYDNQAKDTLLSGTICKSILSDTFFSNQNMNTIQLLLRKRIYEKTKYTIGKQDNTELQIIMRSIFLEYARHLPTQIQEQVQELNNRIVQLCIPNMISEIRQYIHYVHEVENMPIPLDMPKNVSSAGTRTLPSVTNTF